MNLYFRRRLHQDTKGLINRQTVTKFLLHARMQFTPDEAALINKYQIGRYFIWERSDEEIRAIAESGQQPFPDTIRIDKLTGDGVNVVFDSFTRILNAEDEIKKSVQDFAFLLTEAREFETEKVFEY
jgi:hypothetical protein